MDSPYSNKIKEFTIEPGCPWYEAQQSYGAPNVNWCEPTVCSVISEPANTWSNLAYLLVGLILIKKLKIQPLKSFSYAVLVMGLFSFNYHVTNNFLTQSFDFIGMFLMMSFVLAFNLKRNWSHLHFFSTYWFLVFANTVNFLVFDIMDIPPQPIMLINAIPIILSDLLAGYREGSFKKYKYFFLALLFLGVAQIFAVLDIKRIWCEPSNLILHGHVLWHCIGSVGLLFLGLHLRRVSPKD